jgi:hypothetical protein
MRKTLFNIGGAANILFGLFHIWMGRAIHLSDSLTPGNRGLMQIFNIGTILLVFFFAYISFFCQRDLANTKLGKTTAVLIAIIYILRAVEEPVFFQFSLPVMIPCLLTGGIYIVPLFLTGSDKKEELQGDH